EVWRSGCSSNGGFVGGCWFDDRHAEETGEERAGGGSPDGAVRAAPDSRPTGALLWPAAVGGGCAILRIGPELVAPSAWRPSLGSLPGSVPGAVHGGARHVRRTRHRRRPVRAPPLQRRVVLHREAAVRGELDRPVPATEAGPGPGPLVPRYVRAGLPDTANPHGEGLPAACGAVGPRGALPGRTGPVGHPWLG